MKNSVHILLALLLALNFAACEGGSSAEADVVEQTDTLAALPVEEQIDVLQKQLEVQPDNPELWFEKAKLNIQRSKFQLALDDIERAIEQDSLQPEYYNLQSSIYWNLRSSRGALDALERSKELDSTDINTYIKLGEIYFYLADRKQSFENLNQALRLDKFNARPYFIKGLNYKEMGDTAQAISNFQTAVDINSDFYEPYVQLGLLYPSQDPYTAIAYIENALRLEPRSVEALYTRAMIHQHIDSLRLAKRDYRAILRINQVHPNASYNLGYLLMLQDSFQQAYAYFSQAVRADTTFATAYYARGVAALKMGEKESAREDFQQTLELVPEFEEARMELENM